MTSLDEYLAYRRRKGGFWKDNIKMDCSAMGCEDVDWIELVEDRIQWQALVNTVINLQVPWNRSTC
jgi:hypothetical protein